MTLDDLEFRGLMRLCGAAAMDHDPEPRKLNVPEMPPAWLSEDAAYYEADDDPDEVAQWRRIAAAYHDSSVRWCCEAQALARRYDSLRSCSIVLGVALAVCVVALVCQARGW